MSSSSLSRRRLLQAAGVTAVASAAGPALLGPEPAAAAVVPPARADIGVSAYPFDLGRVRLSSGRLLDNQNRTLSYLRFVDVDRLLYNFRANHRLSTNGAAANGGWDAPSFPFRTHVQGHFLTAWAQAYAVLGDTTCRDKANYMVAELASRDVKMVLTGEGGDELFAGYARYAGERLARRVLHDAQVHHLRAKERERRQECRQDKQSRDS